MRKLAIKFIIFNRKHVGDIFLFFYLPVFYLFSLKNNLKSKCYVFVTACSPRRSPAPAAPGLNKKTKKAATYPTTPGKRQSEIEAKTFTVSLTGSRCFLTGETGTPWSSSLRRMNCYRKLTRQL